MGQIERYIVRQVLSAFGLCLVALLAVVWLTQALKEFDVMTSQGQTLILFARFTALIIPSLVVIIAPIALFIACLFTLNRMNRDSELVIFSASGASKMVLVRPFAIIGVVLTIIMFIMSLYVIPNSFREMRQIITQVRADFLTTIVKPGRFAQIEKGLTFHVRARDNAGTLQDIMLHDGRNLDEPITYLAQLGLVAEAPSGSYLVMQDGVIQRESKDTGQVIVSFDRYVFDLSQFARSTEVQYYKPKEKTTAELINPDPNDPYFLSSPERLKSELYERFSAPLYGLSFVFIALALLGDAVSTRQNKSLRIIIAIVLMVFIRGLGFGLTSLSAKSAVFVPFVFALPLGSAVVFAYLSFGHGRRVTRALKRLSLLLSKVFRPVLRPLQPFAAKISRHLRPVKGV